MKVGGRWSMSMVVEVWSRSDGLFFFGPSFLCLFGVWCSVFVFGVAGRATGAYVHGLFVDGAGWQNAKNKADRSLVEAIPKVLFAALPVLHVSASSRAKKPKDSTYGANGPFMAPCYKYPARTDRYYIFMVALPPGREFVPSHWCLRGVALLCSTN